MRTHYTRKLFETLSRDITEYNKNILIYGINSNEVATSKIIIISEIKVLIDAGLFKIYNITYNRYKEIISIELSNAWNDYVITKNSFDVIPV